MSNSEDCIDTIQSDQYMMYSNNSVKRIEHLKYISTRPEKVIKKIYALRKLQVNTSNLEAEFHRQVYELQTKFENKHREIFEKRKSIINGDYEPTEEECDFSIPILPPEVEEKLNETKSIDVSQPGPSDIKGIPDFWLTVLKYSMESLVKEQDEPALKHLADIRSISLTEPEMSFTLEFEFLPNEYFSDKILTKQYFLKCNPEPEDPFTFDGPEIKSCIGCNIHWYQGKNLTLRTIKKKGSNYETTTKTESFFNFFSPPKPVEDENDPIYEDVNIVLDADYEVANYLRDRIVPMAVLFYTGEMNEGSEVSSNSSESVKDLASDNDDIENIRPSFLAGDNGDHGTSSRNRLHEER